MADEVEQAAEGLRELSRQARQSAKEFKEQQREAEAARRQFADAARSEASLIAGNAAASLGRAGASGTDVLFGATSGLQRGLPALGAAAGFSVAGPLGAVVGGAVGELGAAGVERLTGQRRDAIEQARAEVIALGASRAANGVPLSDAQVQAALSGAFERAMRQQDFAARVRSQTDLSEVLGSRGGR